MTDGKSEVFDVIVLGGGPGGSTAATLLAMQGRKVLLLDRDKFPRHQVGESLLPSTVHFMIPMLGLWEEASAKGYTQKVGAGFRWGKSPEVWSFQFHEEPRLEREAQGYAWQVDRAGFDDMLLRNAQRKGADVRENHTATDLIVENDRVVGVRFTDASGAQKSARAKFVVDAQGHSGKFFSYVGKREYSTFFRNVALYGYFKGGKRLPPPLQGSILCEAFDEGWFWFIPVRPDLTSVGAVIDQKFADQLKGNNEAKEAAYKALIDKTKLVKEYLTGVPRITDGMYGDLRLRKDWSYSNSVFWKPGICLVGDSACFVDPILSTGVHLAQYSALLAARSINTMLAGGTEEKAYFEEFERRYRNEFNKIYDMMNTFYDMNLDQNSYYWSARKITSSTEASNVAFVKLVAGVSSEDFEPEFFAKQKEVGQVLQKWSGKGLHSEDKFEALAAELREKGMIPKSRLGVPFDGPRTDSKVRYRSGLKASEDLMRWVADDGT